MRYEEGQAIFLEQHPEYKVGASVVMVDFIGLSVRRKREFPDWGTPWSINMELYLGKKAQIVRITSRGIDIRLDHISIVATVPYYILGDDLKISIVLPDKTKKDFETIEEFYAEISKLVLLGDDASKYKVVLNNKITYKAGSIFLPKFGMSLGELISCVTLF